MLHFMVDSDDVITCNVVETDKQKAQKVQKVTMGIDSDNYDREYIDVNDFIENSEYYLENVQKVVENVKKIDRSSKSKLGRIANGITKALSNDFDTRYSGLRDIGEAVKLLKKNGYRLTEAYDAVTAHKNEKGADNKDSYYTNVLVRLKNALAEEGIESKVSSTLAQGRNAIKNVFGIRQIPCNALQCRFSL